MNEFTKSYLKLRKIHDKNDEIKSLVEDTLLDEAKELPIPTIDDISKYENDLPMFYRKEDMLNTRGFICSDGSFISTHTDPHIKLEHELQDKIAEKYNLKGWFKELNLVSDYPLTQNIFNWVRVNSYNESMIALPPNKLTKEQADTLEFWLEKYFDDMKEVSVVADDGQQVDFDYSNDIKRIIQRINQFYTSGKLIEEVEKPLYKYIYKGPIFTDTEAIPKEYEFIADSDGKAFSGFNYIAKSQGYKAVLNKKYMKRLGRVTGEEPVIRKEPYVEPEDHFTGVRKDEDGQYYQYVDGNKVDIANSEDESLNSMPQIIEGRSTYDYKTGEAKGTDIFDTHVLSSSSEYLKMLPGSKDYNYFKENKNRTAKIVQMSPNEYYKECADKIFSGTSVEKLMSERRDDLGDLEDVITKDHKKFPMCFINYADNSQEGLHRMMVAGDLFGWDTKFPVLVVDVADKKAEEEWKKRLLERDIDKYILEPVKRYGSLDKEELLSILDSYLKDHYRNYNISSDGENTTINVISDGVEVNVKISDKDYMSESLTEGLSKVDSEGNELSQEQLNYFRNSKIIDGSGKLLVCYHGTENPGFKSFNPSSAKSQFGNYKFNKHNVNYFTTSRKNASSFTSLGVEQDGNVYACYLNIENPFIVDNKNADDIATSFNIKDDRVRKKQIALFNKFWDAYEYDHDESLLPYMNRDLNKLNYEIRPRRDNPKFKDEQGPLDDLDGYYDVYSLGNNSYWGAAHPVMYDYTLDELFDSSMYDEWKENIIGSEEDEDYFLTTDDIVRYVLAMNEDDNTNYDGIIISDILDSKDMFSDVATDIVCLGDPNKIKLITNKTPSTSQNIDEEVLEEAVVPMQNDTLLTYVKDCVDTLTKAGYKVDLDKITLKENDSTTELGETRLYVLHKKDIEYDIILSRHLANEDEKTVKSVIYHELCHYLTMEHNFETGIWKLDKDGNPVTHKLTPIEKGAPEGHEAIWRLYAAAIGRLTGIPIKVSDDSEQLRKAGIRKKQRYNTR